MIETLTAIFVVLLVLALALVGFVVYLMLGTDGSSGVCRNCGGSGRTVVHDRAGRMQMRCPTCNDSLERGPRSWRV